MLKLGIIVCAHGNARAVSRLCKEYSAQHVDAIALCGDLGDNFFEINAVLRATAGAKAKIIAFPGSHEPETDFYRALRKNKRVIDGTKKRRIALQGYDVVLLPGSTVNTANAGFRILDGKRIPKEYAAEYRVFSIAQLGRFVRNAAKTVVLCHDPPKCAGKNAIDVAYSGVVRKTFLLHPKHAKIFGKKLAQHRNDLATLLHAAGSIVPQPFAGKLAKFGYPIFVKHRNVGNVALKQFLKSKRIPFFACGHIHEAGHRAVSAAGKSLKPGVWSPSVWYNAAPAVNGNGGILIIDGKKATYKNVKVTS
jgi:Icc-related predicted phosphoesterase